MASGLCCNNRFRQPGHKKKTFFSSENEDGRGKKTKMGTKKERNWRKNLGENREWKGLRRGCFSDNLGLFSYVLFVSWWIGIGIRFCEEGRMRRRRRRRRKGKRGKEKRKPNQEPTLSLFLFLSPLLCSSLLLPIPSHQLLHLLLNFIIPSHTPIWKFLWALVHFFLLLFLIYLYFSIIMTITDNNCSFKYVSF